MRGVSGGPVRVNRATPGAESAFSGALWVALGAWRHLHKLTTNQKVGASRSAVEYPRQQRENLRLVLPFGGNVSAVETIPWQTPSNAQRRMPLRHAVFLDLY